MCFTSNIPMMERINRSKYAMFSSPRKSQKTSFSAVYRVGTVSFKFTQRNINLRHPPHSKNLQAVIYFGQGLDALDAGRWQDAQALFIKSNQEDPEFLLARRYSDNCPDPTVVSISTLTAMTVDQLAGNVETAVNEASDAEADVNADVDPRQEEEPSTGGISIEW